MDETNNYHPKFMHKDEKNRDICSFWIELTSFTVQTTKKFQRQNKVSALTYVTKKKNSFFQFLWTILCWMRSKILVFFGDEYSHHHRQIV